MYLYLVRNQKIKIANLKERIVILESAKLTGEYILKSGSGSKAMRDKISGNVAKLMELKQQLIEEIGILEVERIMLDDKIKELPAREQIIARLRYIKGLDWKSIAAESNYSKRQCMRINQSIIEKMSPNVT